MIPSLQKLNISIPVESRTVQFFFNIATTNEDCGNFTRYGSATIAISGSIVNLAGYTLVIANRLVTAIIYVDFKNIAEDCYNDARRGLDSFYFAAGMTAFIFATAFSSKFSLKSILPPLKPEDCPPILQSPFSLVLESLRLPPQTIKGTPFKIYADWTDLGIDPIEDINNFLDVLQIKPELVLICTKTKEAYLIRRNMKYVQDKIREGHMTVGPNRDALLQPIVIPISPPEPQQLPAENIPPTLPPSQVLPAVKPIKMTCNDRTAIYGPILQELKYRHALLYFGALLYQPNTADLRNQVEQAEQSILKEHCSALPKIIEDPAPFADAKAQYEAFVIKLRSAKEAAKKAIFPRDNVLIKWIEHLSRERFNGLNFYGYCEGVVEAVTGDFKEPLSLDNFGQEFQKRNETVRKATIGQVKNDIPYLYGEMHKDNRVIRILQQQGASVEQPKPSGVLGYLSWRNASSAPPEFSSDYLSFVEGAQTEKILHLIFGAKLLSPQEKTNLDLVKYSNFFPVFLCMKGPFFYPENYTTRQISDVKKQFAERLLKEIPEEEDFQRQVDRCITDVEQNYFSGKQSIDTLAEYQAFILLTYVQLTHLFCEKLNISILEAHCTDGTEEGNAFKAIFILDHLYRTGHLNSQMLQQVMVSIIAASLIAKEHPVSESCANLIHHVIKVIQQAAQTKKRPDDPYAYEGNFTVLTAPYQGTARTGGVCRSAEEYKKFIDKVKKGDIVLESTIAKDFVEECAASYKRSGKVNREAIKKQFRRELKGLFMTCNEVCLNPNRTQRGLDCDAVYENIPDQVMEKLKNSKIPEEKSWDILTTFQQALGKDLFEIAQPVFENKGLKYTFLQDQQTVDLQSGLFLTTQEGKASTQLVALFKVIENDPDKLIDLDHPVARVRVTMIIDDHRTGHATIKITVL